MTRRRNVTSGEDMLKGHTKGVSGTEDISVPDVLPSSHDSDDRIQRDAQINERKDGDVGQVVDAVLQTKGARKPFLYTFQEWNNLNFEDLARENRPNWNVIIVESNLTKVETDPFYRSLDDYHGKTVYEYLNSFRPKAGKAHAGWSAYNALRKDRRLAKEVLSDGMHYILTGLLIRHDSYSVPYLYLENDEVRCGLLRLNAIIDSTKMRTFTV